MFVLSDTYQIYDNILAPTMFVSIYNAKRNLVGSLVSWLVGQLVSWLVCQNVITSPPYDLVGSLVSWLVG